MFQKYVGYFTTLVRYLQFKVSNLFIDEDSKLSESKAIKLIKNIDFKNEQASNPPDSDDLAHLSYLMSNVENHLKTLLLDIYRNLLKSIFLCHSSNDKSFVRKLSRDLILRGAKVWMDEAEIKLGDSLFDKIGSGIKNSKYLGVILSKASTNSNWVKKELDIALNREIKENRVVVLPILLENCELPPFLESKLYADFSVSEYYASSFK